MNRDGARGALNRIEPLTLFFPPDEVICSYACIKVDFRSCAYAYAYSRVCVCVCVCVLVW